MDMGVGVIVRSIGEIKHVQIKGFVLLQSESGEYDIFLLFGQDPELDPVFSNILMLK